MEEIPTSESKRFLLPLAILVALVLVGGACFYFYQKIAKPDPISLLPEDTAFYIEIKINSENQQVKNFKSILKKFPYYEKIVQKIGQTFEKIKEDDPFLKNFDFTISNELIFAQISPFEEEMKEPPLILILPNPNSKKLKTIIKDVEKAIKENENWKLEKETYKEREILKVLQIVKIPSWMKKFYPSPPRPPEPKCKLAFSFINGHLFLSSKAEDIKKIIDIAEDQEITSLFKKEKIKSIASSKAYKKIKKYLPKDYLVLFYGEVNWSEFLRTAEVETPKEVESFFPFLASLKSALNLPFFKKKEIETTEKIVTAGAIIAEKNEIKSEVYSLDLRKDAFLPSQFSLKDSLTNFIPEKIGKKRIVYFFEGKNLNAQILEIKKQFLQDLTEGEKEKFEKILEELKDILEVNLEKDIFSLFEKNFSFFSATEDLELADNEPSLIGGIFEIENEEKVKENLLKLKIPKIELEDIFGLSQSIKRTKDAKIMADMYQMRTIAEMIYFDYGNYWNVNCNYGNMKVLCQDIKKQVGTLPVIHRSSKKYCFYTKLNELGAYYCIDSETGDIKTYINPGQTGYCTGVTFTCPKEQGIPPSEVFFQPETEKISFSKEIIDGFEIYTLPILKNFGLNFSIRDKKLIFAFNKSDLIDVLESISKSEKKLKDSEIFTNYFKEIPKNITGISFAYPYGFWGTTKYLANFYITFFLKFSGLEIMNTEKITSALNELLDKGIAPYIKMLKFSGSYSYSLEKNLIVTKGKLIIQELSEREKKETETFWDNFRLWLMEKTRELIPSYPPSVYQPSPPTYRFSP